MSSLQVEELEPRTMMSCTMPGVAGNPALFAAMSGEVNDVLKLVPDASVTNWAIKSGNWSDPSIWTAGEVPTALDNVRIELGTSVVIDNTTAVANWIRVDGKLQFSQSNNSLLAVDTVIVNASGEMDMVSTDPAITQTLTFSDNGPIDRAWDPKGLSRQLIALGTMDSTGLMTAAAIVTIEGAVRTSWTTIPVIPKGVTSFTLDTAPVGWLPGDKLLFAGTGPGSSDETIAIQSINGAQVTLATPTQFVHTPPAAPNGIELEVAVANLTRNVTLQSANTSTDPQRNGCTMFMHTMEEVSLQYASFVNLGRTDKSLPFNNPVLDSSGHLVAGTGTNVVGRYAIHFHRNYNFEPDCFATVSGCVVSGGPGWGYDNHSSNVNFQDNISYGVYGAGFATEAGNEQGLFHHNLVVNSQITKTHPSPGSEQASNGGTSNFGFAGQGFWFQGTEGISVRDNYVAEVNDAAYVVYGKPLDQGAVFTSGVWNANVVDQRYVKGGTQYTMADHLPFRDFVGNTAAVAAKGFESPWLMSGGNANLAIDQNNVDDFVGWELSNLGIAIDYANQIHVHNATLLASANAAPGAFPNPTQVSGSWGYRGFDAYSSDMTLADSTIIGFGGGFYMPRKGASNAIHGTNFIDCKTVNVLLGTFPQNIHFTTIDGSLTFGTQHATPGKHYDWYMEKASDGDGGNGMQGMSKLDPQNAMILNTVQNPNSQIFLPTQAYGYMPFVSDNFVPLQLASLSAGLMGKTNGQQMTAYGRAYAGVSAPIDAVPLPNSNNLLVGKQQPQKPAWVVPAESNSFWRAYTNNPTFIPKVPGLPNFPAVTLQEGWQYVPETVGGLLWSERVFLDTQPPWWTLSPTQPTTAPLSPIPTAFKVSYTFFDNTVPAGTAQSQNVNLAILPIQTAPDGSKFVTVRFDIADFSGNKTTLTLNVTLQ